MLSFPDNDGHFELVAHIVRCQKFHTQSSDQGYSYHKSLRYSPFSSTGTCTCTHQSLPGTAPSAAKTMSTDESNKEKSCDGIPSDSIPLAVGVLWILPLLIIAALTRFAIDNGPSFLPQQSRPISVAFDQAAPSMPSPSRLQPSSRLPSQGPSKEPTIEFSSPLLSNKPFSYQEVRNN